MTITYTILDVLGTSVIRRNSDMAHIPTDPLNRDYQQYLIDAENGAQVITLPIAKNVPDSIPLWQAKAELQNIGILSSVTAYINSQNNETLTLFWNTATTLTRQSPMLLSIGQVFSLSSDQIDNLFISASKIQL